MQFVQTCSPTKHLLDFNDTRNLCRFSNTTSIAGDDPELVFCTLGHMGQRVLAHLGGSGVAQSPFNLVHLLHLNKVASNNRSTFFFRRQPGQ